MTTDANKILKRLVADDPATQALISAEQLASVRKYARRVLVRRNHERWAPAFLISRTVRGGCQLLSFDPEERTHRVKSGAQVVEIPANIHDRLVKLYQTLQRGCEDAVLWSARPAKRLGGAKSSKGKPGKVHHP